MNADQAQQSLLDRDRARWISVPASQLDATDEKLDWIVQNVIAPGHATLLLAHPKAGKTTLFATWMRHMDRGGELVGRVRKCKLLVVSEERRGIWAQRRRLHQYSDNILFMFMPFVTRPSLPAWVEFIRALEVEVRDNGIGLVVFDTISRFWACKEENSATEVTDCIAPLELLKEAGAAVLLIHHLRKSDGAESTGSRGSGALTAMVDVIVELRRMKSAKPSDKRREMTVSGRFSDSPPATVLEYRDGVYVSIGSRADVSQADRLESIRAFLDTLPASVALTKDEIIEQWPEELADRKPGERQLGNDLKAGVERQMWLRFGSGRRGDPNRFAVRALTGEVGAQRIDDPKIRCAHTPTLKSVHGNGETQ